MGSEGPNGLFRGVREGARQALVLGGFGSGTSRGEVHAVRENSRIRAGVIRSRAFTGCGGAGMVGQGLGDFAEGWEAISESLPPCRGVGHRGPGWGDEWRDVANHVGAEKLSEVLESGAFKEYVGRESRRPVAEGARCVV